MVADMGGDKLTKEQIGDLGTDIYLKSIRHLVEPGSRGKFVAIDVKSGDFELADDLMTASKLLKRRRPGSVRFGVKVGYPSAFRVGWRGQRGDD